MAPTILARRRDEEAKVGSVRWLLQNIPPGGCMLVFNAVEQNWRKRGRVVFGEYDVEFNSVQSSGARRRRQATCDLIIRRKKS